MLTRSQRWALFLLATAVAGVRPAAEDRAKPMKLWAIVMTITSLPAAGQLLLGGTPVAPGQIVSAAAWARERSRAPRLFSSTFTTAPGSAAGPGGHALRVLLDTGTDPSAVDAQAVFRYAFALDGASLDGAGRSAEAIDAIRSFTPVSAEDRAEAQRQLALAHEQLGDRVQAEQHLLAAVAARPESWVHWSELGAFRLRAGNLAGARLAFERADQLAPESQTLAKENLATLLYLEARYAEALEAYRRAYGRRVYLGGRYRERLEALITRLREKHGFEARTRGGTEQLRLFA